jgi:hypothetical protein
MHIVESLRSTFQTTPHNPHPMVKHTWRDELWKTEVEVKNKEDP